MTTKYTKEHEWISVEGDVGTVGITDYAQKALGDVVFVEVPEAGTEVDQGGEVAVVESVKAASEIYSPVAGKVTEGNATLDEAPETINSAPESDGWIFKLTLTDAGQLDGLMDEAAYREYLKELD